MIDQEDISEGEKTLSAQQGYYYEIFSFEVCYYILDGLWVMYAQVLVKELGSSVNGR